MKNKDEIKKIFQGRNSGKKLRIAIAMSGGVDSAVAAKILKDQGHDVVGFMMKLWSDPSCPSTCPRENACCDDQGVLDAEKVANQLGIPFYVVNAKEAFKKEVVDYFLTEHKNLRTPNPCVICNEKIKFGWLLDFAKSVGCDYLATGHYARITSDSGNPKHETRNSKPLGLAQGGQITNLKNQNNLSFRPRETVGEILLSEDLMNPNEGLTSVGMTRGEEGRDDAIYHLLRGIDENKDQSYFLHRLNQEQLSQIMFPVGKYIKEEVRAMAKKWNLPVFSKRESQEICFVHDKDFREFLKRNISDEFFKSGTIVDKAGNVLGQHEGLINYTVGQRRGIDQIYYYSNCSKKIPNSKSQTEKQPLYVVGFNKEKNQLIVGEDTDIYEKEMIVEDLYWIDKGQESKILDQTDIKVKIRYRHTPVGCRIEKLNSKNKLFDSIKVYFDEPQRAVTPGQSAVFYLGDEVLGGGTISS